MEPMDTLPNSGTRRCPRAYLESLQKLAQERLAGGLAPQRRTSGTEPSEHSQPQTLPAVTSAWTGRPDDCGIKDDTGRKSHSVSDNGNIEQDNQEDEASQESSSPSDFNRNPLVNSEKTFTLDSNGKYWYLGPTSSWAFCRRVLGMLGRDITQSSLPTAKPWSRNSYNLSWSPLGSDQQPSVDDLPPYDYAGLLVHNVKYQLGFLNEIIDINSFMQKLNSFYENPAEVASRSRLWYSQFLLILAFGEAFGISVPQKSSLGCDYAVRALSLIPNFIAVDAHSLEAIETLCLAALYLQSFDMRLMAYQYIGQALRLCIIDGMQRHMPFDEVSLQHSTRCNTIFWITYILDREFSALIGSPSSIRDEDITTKLPSEIEDSSRAMSMTLQIRLSRVTATILSEIYGVGKSLDGSLLKNMQTVLHDIASISADLSSFLTNKFQGTDLRTSKIGTRLILSYHYCVVLTTRPLVMCLLQKRISQSGCDSSVPEGPVKSLLESCLYSALNILKTLKALDNSNMLESFLPFQLETVFSSAFLLYIVDIVSPNFVPDHSWLSIAHEILDTMIGTGNPAAEKRKVELQCLENIMLSFLRDEADTVDAQLSEVAPGSGSEPSLDNSEKQSSSSWIQEPIPNDLLGAYGGFMLSPNEILGLAEGLSAEDFTFRE